MEVEHLFSEDPNRDPLLGAAHKPSRSTLFLQKIIRFLRVASWIAVILFGLVFLCSLLGLAHIEPFASQLFADISPLNTLVSSFSMVIGTGVFLIILKQLRHICLTLLAGDPFVPQNAKRLRIIWMAVACGEIFRLFSGVILSGLMSKSKSAAAISDAASQNNIEFSIDFRMSVWFLVLAFIIFAEVFREGARLRQEQQFTV